jgi:hypothetical protein
MAMTRNGDVKGAIVSATLVTETASSGPLAKIAVWISSTNWM